jgi:glutathione peroxidase-family protein
MYVAMLTLGAVCGALIVNVWDRCRFARMHQKTANELLEYKRQAMHDGAIPHLRYNADERRKKANVRRDIDKHYKGHAVVVDELYTPARLGNGG